jgi:dihydroorotate dehydrogenase (fumarate)
MDLATRYLGLALRNPLVASASPLNLDLGHVRALEDHGAAAVVLPSIFQEQIAAEEEERELRLGAGADSFPEALRYFPSSSEYHTSSDRTLETIAAARRAVGIPVIASLNGATEAGWIDHARLLQQAGASAIELNIFFVPSDPALTADMVEQRYLAVLRSVRSAVTVPIAVKLSPYFTAPVDLIRRMAAQGADGFVLFNRFYQPDIDLAALQLQRDLTLSTPAEIRLPLLWIAILAGRLDASLAASTGVETAAEVVKYLLAGADVVMTTSALLRHGPAHMGVLLDGLRQWLDARGVTAAEIRGRMSQARLRDPTAFERANYIRILQGWRG